MQIETVKLKSLEYKEWVGENLEWEINNVKFGDFRVLLGDNAQGKTRIFNILIFLHRVHTGSLKFENPAFRSECKLCFLAGTNEITYQISMKGSNPGPGLVFDEIISRDKEILFERGHNLIEEKSGRKIENFFLPDTSPAISSIKGEEYPTINALRQFFERIIFLQANRFSSGGISIDVNALKLDPTGSNIGSVLTNWKEKLPLVYNEVIEAFQDCFPSIREIITKEITLPGVGISAPGGLALREDNIEVEIDQVNWSDGFIRALCLFALPCTQFQNDEDDIIRPSFICVDEIENGLDFNTLLKVIEHYEAYSNLVQIVISTHSPLVCNLTKPEKWLVIKRRGVEVRAFSPREVEDLNTEMIKLRSDNWEFYRRHIAKSALYKVQ